jgi:hypothetical protein
MVELCPSRFESVPNRTQPSAGSLPGCGALQLALGLALEPRIMESGFRFREMSTYDLLDLRREPLTQETGRIATFRLA